MNRRLGAALKAWAQTRNRKPLVVRGARQVGKSYLVRTSGAEHFGKVVELNFEREPRLKAAALAPVVGSGGAPISDGVVSHLPADWGHARRRRALCRASVAAGGSGSPTRFARDVS